MIIKYNEREELIEMHSVNKKARKDLNILTQKDLDNFTS
jgi:hypothetical protein